MDRRKLQSDVLEQLQWEPGVNSADIGVTVKSGVVALSGKVDSLAKKSAIETEIHSSVEGAREPNATDEPKHCMESSSSRTCLCRRTDSAGGRER